MRDDDDSGFCFVLFVLLLSNLDYYDYHPSSFAHPGSGRRLSGLSLVVYTYPRIPQNEKFVLPHLQVKVN
jgi:hypothetical protein